MCEELSKINNPTTIGTFYCHLAAGNQTSFGCLRRLSVAEIPFNVIFQNHFMNSFFLTNYYLLESVVTCINTGIQFLVKGAKYKFLQAIV